MIGFITAAEPIFCRTPPSGCLCALLEGKRIKEIKWCVFLVLSLTFFFVALQGLVGEIRTNQVHFSLKNGKKIKNSQPQTEFTGSYKKESVLMKTCLNE